MPSIFISYRRDDSEFPSHLIYNKLCERFHSESVFIDVDAIPPGVDFREHLSQAVAKCDVLLAVIGKHWLDITDSNGRRRLEDDKDFVRIEIESALARGIPAIPILLGNASMPKENQLPASMGLLAYRHAIPISAGRDFDSHVKHLIDRLEHQLGFEPESGDSTALGSRKFREIQLLGRGGMGEVWLAYDESLKRNVAIKRIRRELLKDEGIRKRFLQEARSCAKLSHPNIVRILSIENNKKGPFLVLELLEGGCLRKRLQSGRLTLDESIKMMRQLTEAINYSHSEGIIHRDIKPENILMDKNGIPKLADFGLAWILHEYNKPHEPEHNPNEGTFEYMAPEIRFHDQSPSPGSDIYSLGATFFEMITGNSYSNTRNKAVPNVVLPVLKQCINKNPNSRYANASELLKEIVELENSLSVSGQSAQVSKDRIESLIRQGMGFLEAERSIDARPCFEKVLAEMPNHVGAETGLLLLALIDGELDQSQVLYDRLRRSETRHPAFDRLNTYLNSIAVPTKLFASTHPVPFSYSMRDLQNGRFTKELRESSSKTLNLGEFGELIVEYFQGYSGSKQFEYQLRDKEKQCLVFSMPQIKVTMGLQFAKTNKSFLGTSKINEIGVTMLLQGKPIQIQAFAKHLDSQISNRYRRHDSIDESVFLKMGFDPQLAKQTWDLALTPIERFASP